MVPCTSCGRHIQLESSCPFCGTSVEAPAAPRSRARTTPARRALHLVGGAVTTVVLAACYGTGGFEDFDNDGYDAFEDCDDNDPDVNPGATEVCDDGVDNDCDGSMDEADVDCGGTDGTDDTDA